MRPAQVARRASEYLARHDVDAPQATAEQLLASVLGTDRAGLYGRDEPLRAPEAKAFGRALCRRCSGVPTQHVVGWTGFRRLTLLVRAGVFVPRPETEVVVDAALEALQGIASPVVVDVGTGTGAIALSVKQERPDAKVWALDRSAEAVMLARENAARCGLAIDLAEGDLLADLDPEATGVIDLVVSNPPYVEAKAYGELPVEVRADPVGALVGGVPVYVELFAQASERLRAGGAVVVEIGEGQGAAVRRAAREAGAVDVAVRPDLNGRDRVVVATWP
ncbi:MAG: peptide chain release factor N(5)-glutamine methyltransferase [Thermoleophilia bacterium]|nr:peptide chain release factor N(5)-glutamine methyltransferase [Thermoleophilia bacterium]MDH5225485.1 peptide chain release factor N(5)-glutamine methyltransferase [Actinomycetota bacterium]